MRVLQDRQNEKWAFIASGRASNTRLAIFVHGFRGSYLSTWGELGDFLQKEADNDPILAEWDYLFIGYDTDSIGHYLNIAHLIATQWHQAALGQAPFARSYTGVAFIGHSLGTLGIRQLLCALELQPSNMRDAIKFVGLFGSPLNGSPLGWVGRLGKIPDAFRKPSALLPGSYAIADALIPGNPQLLMLHEWNKTVWSLPGRNNSLKVKVVLGTDDQVVGPNGLVQWAGDEMPPITKPLDHSGICKITSSAAGTQSVLLDVLKSGLK